MAANNIVNPSALQVGQVLVIPMPTTPTPTATSSPVPQAAPSLAPAQTPRIAATAPPAGSEQPKPTAPLSDSTVTSTAEVVAASRERSYRTEQGDTLSAIASAFGMSAEELAEANNITDPTRLRVGQILLIPDLGEPRPRQPTVVARPAAPTSTGNGTPEAAERFSAPALVDPEDGTAFSGGTGTPIQLTWESVGELSADEEYVVHVGVVQDGAVTEWIQDDPVDQPLRVLSWQVPAWVRGEAPQDSGGIYQWYVQVEQVTRNASSEVTSHHPVSPQSEHRSFTWQ